MCDMKSVLFTPLLATAFLFVSCDKSDVIAPEQNLVAPESSPSASANFVSGWENSATWKTTVSGDNIVYSQTKMLPGITPAVRANGAVLVYARGYNFSTVQVEDKPIKLPFSFYLPWERVMSPYYWTIATADGSATVALEMKTNMEADFLPYKDNIRFRYFVLTDAFLQANNLTPVSVRNLSYAEVLNLTGATQ